MKFDRDVEKTDERLKPLSRKEAEILLLRLEEEHEKMKERLLYQELIVQKTKDEIEKRAEQIQKLKNEMTYSRPFSEDPLTILRDELKKAGIKSAKISDALDDLSDILGSSN